MNAGEPQVSPEAAGNHPSPPPFCRDGFMTTSELPAWSSQPILTQSLGEGRLPSRGIGVTSRPSTTWNFLPTDAGTEATSPFMRRRHDSTR